MVGTSRRVRYIAIGAMVAAVGSGCTALTGESEQEVIVIGADLELSGDGSDLGEVFQTALELRVDQINQQQLLGDRRLELDVRDNRADAQTSATHLREFADDPDVAGIVTGGCEVCILDAVDQIDDQGVPTISLARGNEIASPVEERRYLFKLGPNANHDAAKLAVELERAELETLAVVTTDDPYGETGLAEMIAAADRSDNLDVVLTEQVTAGDESLADVADEIAGYEPEAPPQQQPPPEQQQPPPEDGEPQTGPDAVVVWAPADVTGEVATALDEAGYDGPLYLDAVAADEVFPSGEYAEAMDGAVMVFPETLVIDEVIAVSPANTARQTWFRTYTAEQGTYHAHSSFAADALNVFVDAINRLEGSGGELDRDGVRSTIENTLLDGLSGPITFTTDNHSGLSSQGLTTVALRGDRWRLAG